MRAAYVAGCVIGATIVGFLAGWRSVSHQGGMSLGDVYTHALIGASIGLAVGLIVGIVGLRALGKS